MKIILIIIGIVLFLFLFGEFVLDMIIGAFTIIAGTAAAGTAAVFHRLRRRPQDQESEID